jgi:leucyl/phenylalanyl-tRNA--protein transferase
VLHPKDLRIQRSLRKRVRRNDYQVTMDTDFEQVISKCQTVPRPGQEGTWITGEMRSTYLALHEQGYAHSIEAWQDGELAGGLYGVGLGQLFSGESMFASRPDASKVAFVWLVEQLCDWGFQLVDCQVFTQHLERFGAIQVSRSRYLAQLDDLVSAPGRPGPWTFDENFHPLHERNQNLGLVNEQTEESDPLPTSSKEVK